MRAYNLCMMMVLINCGFFLTAQFGIFDLGDYTSFFTNIQTMFLWSENPAFVIILMGLLVAGSGYLVSTVTSDKGIAYSYFITIFWGSFFIASGIIFPLCDRYNIQVFYAIYGIITILIFLIALIQMPLGGQKSHV